MTTSSVRIDSALINTAGNLKAAEAAKPAMAHGDAAATTCSAATNSDASIANVLTGEEEEDLLYKQVCRGLSASRIPVP